MVTPVSIAFDEECVRIGETVLDWDQARDLRDRLDIVVRYRDMYM